MICLPLIHPGPHRYRNGGGRCPFRIRLTVVRQRYARIERTLFERSVAAIAIQLVGGCREIARADSRVGCGGDSDSVNWKRSRQCHRYLQRIYPVIHHGHHRAVWRLSRRHDDLKYCEAEWKNAGENAYSTRQQAVEPDHPAR